MKEIGQRDARPPRSPPPPATGPPILLFVIIFLKFGLSEVSLLACVIRAVQFKLSNLTRAHTHNLSSDK